jgi:transposase-like protein
MHVTLAQARRRYSQEPGILVQRPDVRRTTVSHAGFKAPDCKNGVSSCESARDLGVTQKTAWFINHRLRFALNEGSFGDKLSGEVEVDETFIGGKARNMHKSKREEKITGRGPEGKTIVAAVLERHGEVRASVVETRRKKPLQEMVRQHVEEGSKVHSDALKSYDGLAGDFTHQVIDHAVASRRWTGSYQRPGELLEPTEARLERHLCERGAVPPFPLR